MICDVCEAESGQPCPFCASCSSILPLPKDASPFEILNLPVRFQLDDTELLAQHKRLSRQLHPDRFARKSPLQKRRALEWTTALNDAFRELRTPEHRADCLLRQRGIDLARESGPEAQKRLTPEFLESVLEEREALAEARVMGDHTTAQRLTAQIKERMARGRENLASLFEQMEAAEHGQGCRSGKALEAAAQALARLRYDARFLEEAESFEREALE